MDDPRFADAVRATGRKKLILSGLTTDFCLVYPATSLMAQGYHVFVVVDASRSWTKEINDAALRLDQTGATQTNVQSIAGELQNAAAVKDLDASKEKRSVSRVACPVVSGLYRCAVNNSPCAVCSLATTPTRSASESPSIHLA